MKELKERHAADLQGIRQFMTVQRDDAALVAALATPVAAAESSAAAVAAAAAAQPSPSPPPPSLTLPLSSLLRTAIQFSASNCEEEYGWRPEQLFVTCHRSGALPDGSPIRPLGEEAVGPWGHFGRMLDDWVRGGGAVVVVGTEQLPRCTTNVRALAPQPRTHAPRTPPSDHPLLVLLADQRLAARTQRPGPCFYPCRGRRGLAHTRRTRDLANPNLNAEKP